MSFFSRLIAPYRKGERNFERGRAAELRRDFKAAEKYFQIAADAFDEHIAKKEMTGQEVGTSHLVMAGICYTRLGRNHDALRVLDECIERRDIPDAFLHAGYAAAKLGDAERTMTYWKEYPSWADQRIIANALNKQIKTISSQETPDLQTVCQAISQAIFSQDHENAKAKSFRPFKPTNPPKRRY
jgi:tetratricopeptide (TPR) repeat protein